MAETKILGVKIDKLSKKEVLKKIELFLLSDSQHYAITLNPEMIIEAQSNEEFKKIINEADLSVADGTGVILANKYLNGIKPFERICGIDLIYDICSSEFMKNGKIYLIGGGRGIAEKAAFALKNKYGDLNIVGAEEGIAKDISNDKFPIINEALIARMNKAKPEILFIAFGAPKQEGWIHENLKKIPSVKFAMGVGGSFDFISGKIRRAPKTLRIIGLEWLWRMALEPKRIGRIYNATIKFAYLILKDKKRKI